MEQSDQQLSDWFERFTTFQENAFHPLVWIVGEPEFGEGVYIGALSEVNGKGAKVVIGDNCDIASFVSINCADSTNVALDLPKRSNGKTLLWSKMSLLVRIR